MRQLPLSFFQKPRPRARQRKNAVGIVPFKFSNDVLTGKKKITMTLTDKDFYETSAEIVDSIMPKAEREELADKYKHLFDLK